MRTAKMRGVYAALGILSLSSPLLAEPLQPGAQTMDLPTPLALGDLIEVLRKHNPELDERRSSARAAAARPRAVNTLPDPSLSFEWWQQPINFANVPLMLTVRQSLPWPGRLRALRAVVESEADTSRDLVTEAERRLEAEAKNLFFDLAFTERSLAINERIHTLLEAMVRSAETKYRVGKAPQAAMLKTQEEVLTIDNERLDLERARDEARARLNALLNRPPGAPLGPTQVDLAVATLPNESELVARAIARRPAVKVASDAIAETLAKLAVARRENNPELAVWAGYMVNVRGIDTFTTGVSTSLPIFSQRRRSSAVEAGEAELDAKRAALETVKRRTEMEIHTALLNMDAALRHERLHSEKLIPLSELSLESAEAAYQNDRIDFFSVLDAARMVRDHHLNHERYLIEYQRRLAELELAVGMDLKEVAR